MNMVNMTTLNADDRRALLREAREALEAAVKGATADSVEAFPDRQAGAFVTLRVDGTLRGCVGQLDAASSLGATVREVAVAAATKDPRFSPVDAAELEAIDVEVSVLGPIELCSGPAAVEIGRHGLVVDDGRRRGLLLPQVAVEWGWDSDTFVANACVKAGLRPDAWKTEARLFTFEADVFSEADAESQDSDNP